MDQVPLRVLLVENPLPIRCRLRSSIEENLPAEIVGEASTIVEALALSPRSSRTRSSSISICRKETPSA